MRFLYVCTFRVGILCNFECGRVTKLSDSASGESGEFTGLNVLKMRESIEIVYLYTCICRFYDCVVS